MPLAAGWNLVTLALQPQFDPDASWLCETVNGNVPGSAVEVVRYLSGGWDSHLCALTANNFMLDVGVGYFVRTTRATSWAYSGTAITQLPARVLTAGWNVIGLPVSTGTAATILSQIDTSSGAIGTAPEMDRWAEGQWDGHISGLPVNVFTIETGRGYAVRVNRPVTWDPVSLIPTRTSTATSTATSSATPTPSPSRTASATATASPTATATASPTATATAPGGDAYTALVAGGYHTCGLASSGTAYCWGLNWNGQLGDGTSGGYGDNSANRAAPVAVSLYRYTALVAGLSHTCGLATDGRAYCWGGNAYGQLGNGTISNGNSSADSTAPSEVNGWRTYTVLAAGGYHTCGLASSGTAYCWGWDGLGRQDDATNWQLTPVEVSGGRKFTALVAGDRHTCSLATGGTAYCWGLNDNGQFGNGLNYSRSPVVVNGGLTFTALVAGGSHTCGLATGGTAYCWGSNWAGQLGDGSQTDLTAPVAVSGGRTFTALVAGANHTCGLASGGTAYCWGTGGSGQLGDGTTGQQLAPVVVTGGRTFTALVAGQLHTCGLATGGTAYCWGHNGYGQLGDGTSGNGSSSANRLSPVAVIASPTATATASPTATATASPTATVSNTPTMTVTATVSKTPTVATTVTRLPGTSTPTVTSTATAPGGDAYTALVAGGAHTCGLATGGTAYCWGYNGQGQLGDGTSGVNQDSSANRLAPVAVSGGLTYVGLVAGGNHTCGLVSGGTAYCWGYNQQGQLGDGTSGTDRTTPVAVSGGRSFTALVAGGYHTCGLVSGGTAYCWGNNSYGQLGDGTGGNYSANRTAPVVVGGGRTFMSLVAGGYHTCGLVSGGTAYCWGSNEKGQVGDGTSGSPSQFWSADRTSPVAVTGGRAYTALVAGGTHTCGLATSGTAYCWGYNSNGQLGDGTSGSTSNPSSADRSAPVAVSGGLTYVGLVAGGAHTCGLATGGTAYCWGYNQQGQLGDGTSGTDRTTPVAVSGGRSFTALVAGSGYTCGLVSGGTAYCWGANGGGALGDGTSGTDRLVPVAVIRRV